MKIFQLQISPCIIAFGWLLIGTSGVYIPARTIVEDTNDLIALSAQIKNDVLALKIMSEESQKQAQSFLLRFELVLNTLMQTRTCKPDDEVATIPSPALKFHKIHNASTLPSLSGRIQHPAYNKINYTANTNITWTLVAPRGHKIRFTIEFVNIESSGAGSCAYDFLEATDGMTQLFKICGDYPEILTSDTNQVTVKFRSDASVEGRGFSLFYESYYQIPPALVPNVTFYNNPDFTGYSTSYTIKINRCINFGNEHKNQIRSVKPENRCFMLFSKPNCPPSGGNTIYYPSVDDTGNSEILNRLNLVSFSACSYLR